MALPNCRALLGIFERRFIRALRHAQAKRGNGDAAAIEHAHGVHKALAFLADQRFFRDVAIFKDQLRGIAGAQAQLVFFFARTKALGAFFHDERREPVRVRGLVRHGDHHGRRRHSGRW